MARSVKDLIEHLTKYKDAVVIVGPGALSEEDRPKYDIEAFNENYNRRNLVRNPNTLWNFFDENMYKLCNSDTVTTYRQLDKLSDVVKLVVDQNMNAPMIKNKEELHGSIHKFVCTKCKTLYTANYTKELGETECELCGAVIRPTALLSGERYDNAMFLKVQELIKQSHTVILVGMDYTEESLMQLIAEYGDVKSFINDEGKEEKMLVSIQTPEEEFDPNEMAFFEFVVKDNIQNALTRLNGAF